jgi:hypothetical protein
MVQAGGWRLRTLGAHPASGGDTRSYRPLVGGMRGRWGRILPGGGWGRGGGAEDAGGASGLGGGRLRTLGAHLASGGGHALVPGDMLE